MIVDKPVSVMLGHALQVVHAQLGTIGYGLCALGVAPNLLDSESVMTASSQENRQ